jgi:hypothetical protein
MANTYTLRKGLNQILVTIDVSGERRCEGSCGRWFCDMVEDRGHYLCNDCRTSGFGVAWAAANDARVVYVGE